MATKISANVNSSTSHRQSSDFSGFWGEEFPQLNMRKKLTKFAAIAGMTTALVSINPTISQAANSALYSPNIASVQSSLGQMGYFSSPPTGIMDGATRNAIMRFQSSIGLNPSGVIDVNTAEAMNQYAISGSVPTYAAPVQAVGYSENIASIQQILNKLGYFNFEPNGLDNDLTRSAIRSFQSQYGLQVTGLVDPQTATALNEAYERAINGLPPKNAVAAELITDAPVLNSKSLLWVGAGAAGAAAIVAAGSGGGGGGSAGISPSGEADFSTQTVSFGLASNDAGNSDYDGTSPKAGFDNPAADDPNTFLTTETLANEGIANMNANEAHARGYDGRIYNRAADGTLLNTDFDDYVVVAVIDSGVDTDHPDLVNNLLLDYDVSCSVSGCLDGAEDDDGHGTAVSGVIAAERNSTGTIGVAPEAKILPVESDLTLAGIVNGFRYANSITNVAVVNNSYGSFKSIVTPAVQGDLDGAITPSDLRTELTTNVGGTTWLEQLNDAVNSNKIIVWSAGNESSSESIAEAALPYYFDGEVNQVNIEGYDWSDNWVNVVSLDPFNALSSFSNECGVTAEWCLAAPGEISNAATLNGGYAPIQGTSFAAPNVSGAVAVLLGAYPHLAPEQVLNILFETADDLGDVGTDEVFGRGLVNLDRATSPADGDWVIASFASSSARSFSFEDSGVNLSAAFGDVMKNNKQKFIFTDRFNKDYTVDLDSVVTVDNIGKSAETRLAEFGRDDFNNSVQLGNSLSAQFTLDQESGGVMREQVSEFGESEDGENNSKIALHYDSGNMNASLGYNVNASEVLGFSATKAAASNELLTSDAYQNPYLAMSDNATAVANEYKSGAVGLKFAAFQGESDSSRLEFVEDEEVSGYVGELNLSDAESGLSLSVQSGVTDESDTFLGSESGGALELSDGSKTYFAGLAASYSPMQDVTLHANYNYGVTKLGSSDNSLIENISDVKSNSFSLGATIDNIYKERDSFGIAVSQPLRVSSASGSITLPQDIDADGNLLFETSDLSLAPKGQEIDVEAFYDIGLSRGDKLSLGSMLRIEPDHVEDADEEALLLMRYKADF